MRSSPLASLSNLSTKAGVAKKIAAAKNELRALTAAQEPSQLADPKRIIPITQDMEVESLPAEQCLKGTSKFVANTAKGGRIHEILTQGDDFHPRDWRTRCGWYFGKGLTSYSMFDRVPSGKKCKA